MKLRRRIAAALTAAAALTTTGLIATALTAGTLVAPAAAVDATAAATTRPGVVVDYADTPVRVQVKPTMIWPFKDLSYVRIRWTALDNTVGYAFATRRINVCTPSCAEAHYSSTKVKLKFSRVRSTVGERRVFTWVKVTTLRTQQVSSHPLPY